MKTLLWLLISDLLGHFQCSNFGITCCCVIICSLQYCNCDVQNCLKRIKVRVCSKNTQNLRIYFLVPKTLNAHISVVSWTFQGLSPLKIPVLKSSIIFWGLCSQWSNFRLPGRMIVKCSWKKWEANLWYQVRCTFLLITPNQGHEAIQSHTFPEPYWQYASFGV